MSLYPDRNGNYNDQLQLQQLSEQVRYLLDRDTLAQAENARLTSELAAARKEAKDNQAVNSAKLGALAEQIRDAPQQPLQTTPKGPRCAYSGNVRSLSALRSAEKAAAELDPTIEAKKMRGPGKKTIAAAAAAAEDDAVVALNMSDEDETPVGKKRVRGPGKKSIARQQQEAFEQAQRAAEAEERGRPRGGRRVEPTATATATATAAVALAATAAAPTHKNIRFSLEVVPRSERLYILDAIKRHQKTMSIPDAFKKIISDVSALDPEYRKKFASVLKNNHSIGSLVNYWFGWLKLDTARVNEIAFRYDANRHDDPSGAEKVIEAKLRSLERRGLLWSIEIALAHIEHSDAWRALQRERVAAREPPCSLNRTRVYLAMKALNFGFQVPVSSLPTNFSTLADRLRVELRYLTSNYNIPDTMIFNIDETCLKMFPMPTRQWCRKGFLRAAQIRATKAYTTVMVGCSLSGTSLPPCVNYRGVTNNCLAWKGAVPDDIKDDVFQYNQGTYWSTTDSLMHYIRKFIIPLYAEEFKKNNKTKFVLIWDQAPVHNSLATRKLFQEKFGKYGFLVYIPRCCTSKLQPMDQASRFGAFKSHVKAQQAMMAATTTMQHRLLAWNLPKVKEVVMRALASGHKEMCGRVDRSSAWQEIAKFKTPECRELMLNWTSTEEERSKNQLFEYGWPGTNEVAERSKFYVRPRARDSAWEDVVDDDGDFDYQHDFPVVDDNDLEEVQEDLGEDFTDPEMDGYYLGQSDDEEDEDRKNKPQPVL